LRNSTSLIKRLIQKIPVEPCLLWSSPGSAGAAAHLGRNSCPTLLA